MDTLTFSRLVAAVKPSLPAEGTEEAALTLSQRVG